MTASALCTAGAVHLPGLCLIKVLKLNPETDALLDATVYERSRADVQKVAELVKIFCMTSCMAACLSTLIQRHANDMLTCTCLNACYHLSHCLTRALPAANSQELDVLFSCALANVECAAAFYICNCWPDSSCHSVSRLPQAATIFQKTDSLLHPND